ncbi:hypothetical protein JS534_11270 [Bifidobacterium felsineum]|nr:hypothetical protein [Bifidobacterium felsineum]
MRKYTHSGYRAVHVIAGLPRGIFAEIQVRTLPQDAWANAFEALADRLGRNIRYGEIPQDTISAKIVKQFFELSDSFGAYESHHSDLSAASRISTKSLVDMMRKIADYIRDPDLTLLDEVYRIVNNDIQSLESEGGAYGGHGNPVQPEDRRQNHS